MLSTLPSDWTAFQDVCWSGGLGPTSTTTPSARPGSSVIDSKNWSGRVCVDGDTLRQNGRSHEAAVRCADAALAVSELAGDFARCALPMLCLVRDDKVAGRARDAAVYSTSNLLDLLQTRSVRLTPEQVRTAS